MIEKEYSVRQILQLIGYYIYTKIVCRSARLLRFPLEIRGKKYINFGKQLTTGKGCRFEVFKSNTVNKPKLVFGRRVQVNDYVHICALEKIEIGDDVLIASHVYISDNSHGSYKGTIDDSSPLIPPIDRIYSIAPVKIGNRVWIGEGVMILPGVEIGDGTIIGAHAVVDKSIPANSMAVGSPAKVIKKYNYVTQRWERIK